LAAHRLLPGERFAERFVVDRLVGAGSMAIVYAVRTLDTGTPAALKVLRPHVVDEDPKAFDRFMREARVGGAIQSEHVVNVWDSGIHEDHPWLLMELLDGVTLDKWMATDPARLMRWTVLDQLFGAMGRAHHAAVIHRDLKCENIFVLDRGQPFVKLLDFGIAKTLQRNLVFSSLTSAGLGTPLWAAPEQGTDEVRVSTAFDVWSLGLLTFYLLTSKIYWRQMNIASSSAIDISIELLRAPIEPATVRAEWLGCAALLPPGFDDWFQHCVNRNPAERFENATAAHAALAQLR
jgi:serine/threonine-protein kinase